MSSTFFTIAGRGAAFVAAHGVPYLISTGTGRALRGSISSRMAAW